MSSGRFESPLGLRASETLAFRSADALRTPDGRRAVLRTLTAMRNGPRPGALWLGVREQDGVAAAFESPEAVSPRVLLALREAALDALVPQPTVASDPDDDSDADLTFRIVAPPGGSAAVVHVNPIGVDAPPAAIRTGDAFEFLRRAGSRDVAIPYAELFENRRFAAPGTKSGGIDPAATSALRDWSDEFRPLGGLAVSVVRTPKFSNSGGVDEPPAAWLEILRKPPPNLARPQGWTWFDPRGACRTRASAIECGTRSVSAAYRVLRLEARGVLRFFTDLRSLQWLPQTSPEVDRLAPGVQGQLGPLCIFESVVSLVRLARRLFVGDARGVALEAEVSLVRAAGHAVPLFVPGSLGALAVDRDDVVVVDGAEFGSAVVRRNGEQLRSDEDADRLAKSLLRRLCENDAAVRDLEAHELPWFAPDGTFSPHR